MRICLWLSALCIAALPCAASSTRPLLPVPVGGRHIAPAPPNDPDRFTFALCGDNRSAGRNVPAPPTVARVFAELRLLQPAFVLWTGDAIYGSDDTVGEARADNYNYADLPVSVEFPGEPMAPVTASASWTYKGKTHPLDAVVVPSRAPGVVTVRVIVPKNRSAIVRIHPRSRAGQVAR